MRIQLKTLGCRLNEAELETWARDFKAKGHDLVDANDSADLIVFNSCAVTQDAVRKSRHQVRKAARENPGAKIVLTGCYASLNPSEAESLGVDLVISNQEKQRLIEITSQALSLENMPASATLPGESALFRLGRHRAFIKVQDGCRYRCTYCIVTVARGEERSRPAADVVEEINQLHAEGIQEAVLTGVHLGGYGGESDSRLARLLERVLEGTRIPRIRLGSLEPWDIGDDFIELFQHPRLMPHLHLPFQSGSDSVLRRMARRGRQADYRDLVSRLRHHIPGINITSDLMVGFPGETDIEWQETLRFVEEVAFGDLHIFTFSPRPGTPAAEMKDPVPGPVKKERSLALHALAAQQKKAALTSGIGRYQPVLFEGVRQEGDKTLLSGYTPNYFKVTIEPRDHDPASLSFQILPTLLSALDEKEQGFLGTLAAPTLSNPV